VERRLKAFTRDHRRREKELDRQRAELRRERDRAIRDAHRDGLPIEDIARIVGLSHQHVSRIIRR
jgi:transposase-like protein